MIKGVWEGWALLESSCRLLFIYSHALDIVRRSILDREAQAERCTWNVGVRVGVKDGKGLLLQQR